MGTDQYLLSEQHDQWLEITLNRPDSYNALNEALLAALQQALHDIHSRDDLGCVIIKAKGKAFCAGHDLKEMSGHRDKAYYQTLFQQCSAVMQSIVNLPIPVIAEVQGVATAAGCQLVATCDLAVASSRARFAVSGINLGLFCATPAVALSRNIARKQAMEMLLTGDFIAAQEAQQYGLINRVTCPEDLTTVTRELATKICRKNPVAVRTGKAMFYPQAQRSLAEAYELACEHMVNNLLDKDTEAQINAFVNRTAAK